MKAKRANVNEKKARKNNLPAPKQKREANKKTIKPKGHKTITKHPTNQYHAPQHAKNENQQEETAHKAALDKALKPVGLSGTPDKAG
ncbi:hypothetical protein [Escherichia coli]|uniref:hypothetical protein n=1 Tax=Escherichia coli TaxID=562 RepID=UPI0011E7A60B|nr:hypothetical protein [Escherichia coli]